MEKLGCHSTDVLEILYWGFLLEVVHEIKVLLKWDQNKRHVT
jgi:hypothetical protein